MPCVRNLAKRLDCARFTAAFVRLRPTHFQFTVMIAGCFFLMLNHPFYPLASLAKAVLKPPHSRRSAYALR
jgi:hypothetical protein